MKKLIAKFESKESYKLCISKDLVKVYEEKLLESD